MYVDDLDGIVLPGLEGFTSLRAVGWLERGHEYSQGDVADEFVRALLTLSVNPWQPFATAGVHRCSFCRFSGGPGEVRVDSTVVPVGNRLLVIPGVDSVYVAPSMIVHYVDAHDYSPPRVFQEAVVRCPEMRSMAYLRAVRAHSTGGVGFRRP